MTATITIFTNGRIYSMDGSKPVDTMVTVASSAGPWYAGLILEVGESEILLPRYQSLKPQVVDLRGTTVLPGFTDSHMHLAQWAMELDEPELRDCHSLQHTLDQVALFAQNRPEGSWITGGGWNRNAWDDLSTPTRQDLDKVVPDRPVALRSKDWHNLWLNTRAMDELGLDAVTPGIPGGVIERDANGFPTGILRENAAWHHWGRIPDRSLHEYRSLLGRAQFELARRGITCAHTVDSLNQFAIAQDLSAAGELRLRLVCYLPSSVLPHLLSLGVRTGLGDRRVKVGGIKLFVDGSLGSQTAKMRDPYEGTNNLGIEVMSQEELHGLVATAAAGGLASAVHAIGDAATTEVLSVFNQTRSIAPHLRQRMEHCQLMEPDGFALMRNLNVVASVQPLHFPSDLELVAANWGSRGRYAYAFESMRKTGACMVFGSDAPVEPPHAIRTLHAAVNRWRIGDEPISLWPEEKLSIDNAILASTVNPAYATGDETWRGLLKPGYVADFVCLSDDPFEMPPENLHNLEVLRTVIDGQTVYDAL